MADRWFSQDELEAMGGRTLDHLLAAISDGSTDAGKLAQRMYNEFLSQHDGYRNWTTALLSEIGKRWGDDVLEDVMAATVESWWLPNLGAMANRAGNDRRVKAKMFVAGLRGHLQPLAIVEDDEKVVIRMQPCGSGGRLVLEGKYDGPNAFHKVDGPRKMTFGRRDFPVYCAHEAAMEEIDIEVNGRPLVLVEPGARLGHDQCQFIIYKDPDSIPERYYGRLGRQKPGVDRRRLIASSSGRDE